MSKIQSAGLEPSAIEKAGSGDPLSLAFVCPGWPPDEFANGIVPYVATLAAEMRRAGHQATVLAEQVIRNADGLDVRDIRPASKPSHLVARALDILAFRLSTATGVRRQVVRALRSESRRLIADRGLQLVEMEESFGHARWLQRELPIPVLIRLHGPWFVNGPIRGVPRDDAFRRRVQVEGEAIRQAASIVSPSADVLERTRAHYGLALERAEVVPLPTTMIPPEDRWRPEGCDPDQILFVGRFDGHKGGDLMIDAFAEVARHRPTARLRFVGPDSGYVDDSGRTRKVEEYARERLGDGSALARFEWLGPRPASELPALRREAGVVVVASRYDNLPNTVLEAMAVGAPLVAPRIGGVPEMVDDGVSGLLFRAIDPLDLAAKLIGILEDRDLAARLGHRAGVECERRYAPAVIGPAMERSYRRAIETWARAGRGASR